MIILLRHSESIGNKTCKLDPGFDTRLSNDADNFINDVKNNLLSRYEIDNFYSSDMLRAIQTSQKITNKKIILSKDIREINFGNLKNKSKIKFNHSDYAYKKIPGGESYFNVQSRAWNFITSTSSDKSTNLYVTHGGVICAVLHKLLQVSLSKFPFFSIDYCGCLVFQGATILRMSGIKYSQHAFSHAQCGGLDV